MAETSNPAQVISSDLPTLGPPTRDRTAALMATLARLAYEFPPADCKPGPCLTIRTNSKSWASTASPIFITVDIDGWAYIVEGKDIIATVFRGTQSVQNWGTNFQVGMVNPPDTDTKLHVHSGFFAAFNDLSTGQEGLQTAFDRIKQDSKGVIPIYITGHSLGGALAQIATAVFGCDQIAACYTFGSPRVGNGYFDCGSSRQATASKTTPISCRKFPSLLPNCRCRSCIAIRAIPAICRTIRQVRRCDTSPGSSCAAGSS